MREAIRPRLHLFVCANRRTGSPLGPGCEDHGEAVYNALKSAVRDVARVWITKTHCLGICPKRGCTVARYPQQAILTEVTPEDVPTLLSASAESTEAGPTASSIKSELSSSEASELSSSSEASELSSIENELSALEELQRKKVLDLARRLKPGLTLEDVQNPHDFPELDDPDWHYADGVLAGIASVRSALAASKKRDS